MEAADALMYERGYEAVGVAELCRVARVKKGSFYFFFESKQALALAMLDNAWSRTQSTIFASSLTNPELGGLEAVDAYGHLLAEHLERIESRSKLVTGCRFGNLAAELSTRDEDIRLRLAEIFDEMVAMAAEAVARSVAAGEVAADTDILESARQIIGLMEGLMVLAKAHRSPDLLRHLGPTVTKLLT